MRRLNHLMMNLRLTVLVPYPWHFFIDRRIFMLGTLVEGLVFVLKVGWCLDQDSQTVLPVMMELLHFCPVPCCTHPLAICRCGAFDM